MTYKISKAVWDDQNHECLLLEVIEHDEEGNLTDNFTYAATEDGHAPMSKLLWELAMQNPEAIEENLLVRIRKGEAEVPYGYTYRNGKLFNNIEERQTLLNEVDKQLNGLYSGRSQAMAERDPVYAANRQAHIDLLLDIENQQDFPYIDLSALMEAK